MSFMYSYIRKFKSILFSKDNGNTGVKRYRNIILTGSTSALVKLFTSIIGLITVPLTVNYLGPERYGLWMTMSSFLALMSFADMGLGNGLVNAIAKANGNKNESMAQKAVSSTFVLLSVISLTLFVFFILIYPHVSWHKIFNAQSDLAISESSSAIFVFVIIFLINLPLGIIRRIQDGYQEGYKHQRIMVLGSVFSISGLLLCIKLQAGLPYLVLAFLGGNLTALLLNGFILFGFQRPSLFPKYKNVDAKFGFILIKTGIVFFLLQVFTLIGSSSDNIVIAHILGPAAVADYEIVRKLFTLTMFTQFLIQPLWPAFGEALASGDYNWARSTLQKAIKIGIFSSVVFALPLVIFGKTIIRIWVGENFIPTYGLLVAFLLFTVFASYGGVMSTFLNSGDLLNKQLKMIVMSSIVAIILKILLVNQIGIIGVLWGTLLGYSIFFIFPAYKLSFNYLKKQE